MRFRRAPPASPPPSEPRRRRSRAGEPQAPLASSEGVALLDFVRPDEPERKRKGGSSTAYKAHDRALVEVGEMMGPRPTRSWEKATPAHFVALYARLHHDIYGAEPRELRSEAWWGAVSAATKMLREEFSDRPEAMLDFLRWTWRREREREKKRAAEDADQEARRIGWRLQFVLRHLVTDYRVARERAGRRVNG